MSTTIDPNVDFDLKRGSRVWNEDDLYVPGGTGGRTVPNVNDMTYKFEDKKVFFKQVVEVDYTTFKSTLVLVAVYENATDDDVKDIILLGAPGRASLARRLYVDKSSKPTTASVDIRLWIPGSMAREIRLFRGTDTGKSGEVVSVLYDQSNTLMGETIPLKVVGTVDVPNVGSVISKGATLKVVDVGHLTVDLDDNELVTMVVYGDSGVLLVQELIVYNTHFTRRVDTSRKYVKEVRLKSDFFSEHEDDLILIPRGTNIDAVLLQAELVYNNGVVKEVPIDGTRMQLHGTYSQRYIANRDGFRASIVLTHILDENEFLYGAAIGEVPHMSRRYWVETTPFEAVFGCRIWVVPTWHGQLEGYRLKYYLSTLRRDALIDVTSKVRLAPSSPVFDGRLYGSRQALTLTLNMDEVSPIFKHWKYTQYMDVVLHGAANEPGSNWTLNYQPGQAVIYGLNNKANGDYITAGSWRLNIGQGEPSREAWLNRMYRNTLPIHNPEIETLAPDPDVIRVSLQGGPSSEYLIEQWDAPLSVQGTPAPGSTVMVEFIKRTGNGDLVLGAIGIPFVQVD